jgi:serine/threonine protein kinase
MSTKLGHFEIQSELAKSPTGFVYKANDPESGQTIALKAIQLSAFGEHAQALEKALLAEAESTKVLSSPNITNVYGAGEIEGKFCAAMEYVQGNSIATMLARKEGFSIWDLLDIGRQLCTGLDHAASHQVVHRSLEPSKIMCGWDGTVKILSYGVSSVGDFVHFAQEGLSPILHYMSPEQVRGESMDIRSNLFSLGAMFYEMVTERKAFDRDDIESLRQSIVESTPVAPIHVNPKIHPNLSALIMKVLSKDLGERYQTGRELLDDLEKCKESKPAAAKKAAPAQGLNVPTAAKAAAQSKFVNSAAPKPAAPRPAAPVKPAASSPAPRPAQKPVVPAAPVAAKPGPKAAAAAAGVGSFDASRSSHEVPELDLSEHSFAGSVQPEADFNPPSASMSSAVLDEPEVETFEPQSEESPKITVDPMMAEGESAGGSRTSFSEISELPPLKEVYIAPPPPPVSHQPLPPAAPAVTMFEGAVKHEEKPKVQPREVAEKAIKEIKGVPPKLMLYALAAAGILILIIGIGMTLYIHNLGSEDDPGATHTSKPVQEQTPVQPQVTQPAPQAAAPVETAPAAPVAAQPVEEAPEPVATTRLAAAKSRNPRKKQPAAPVVIPGQIALESTPEGAQVQMDGHSDPSWVTPFALTNVQPGQHSITISKAGYVTDTRTISVTPGNRASSVVHLTQMLATLIVKSDPAGASIYVDGHDVGTKTPAQVSVNKGQHVILVRLAGYLDETMNGQFVIGQTLNFSPTLRALGNVDSIKTVGKMSKFFGGKADPNQGTLSIRTQPKGAQISVNQRMLDKGSPVDVALDPGNYVIDITLSGYAPVHKVITAEKKGKVVIDEVLQPQ